MLERLKTAKEDASDIVRLVNTVVGAMGFKGVLALWECSKTVRAWGFSIHHWAVFSAAVVREEIDGDKSRYTSAHERVFDCRPRGDHEWEYVNDNVHYWLVSGVRMAQGVVCE